MCKKDSTPPQTESWDGSLLAPEGTRPMDERDQFITVREAAERLRVHPQTVRLWLRQGKLQGTLIGGTKSGYRIPRSQITRLLEGQSGGP